MKLTAEQGQAAATALVELDGDACRSLHAVMPRSTVELTRAASATRSYGLAYSGCRSTSPIRRVSPSGTWSSIARGRAPVASTRRR